MLLCKSLLFVLIVGQSVDWDNVVRLQGVC